MKNKKIIIIVITSVILIIAGIFLTIFLLNKEDNKKEEVKQTEKLDEMEEYEYYLEDNATGYYKELYNNLKEILNKEEVNEEEYAKTVSQLFVTDLFTLNNKTTSSDIGGVQFIHSNFKEDFINIAKTTIYSTVESNIYGDREQELPEVLKAEVINIEKTKFTYLNEEYDGYKVNMSIEYTKDLGYHRNTKTGSFNRPSFCYDRAIFHVKEVSCPK